MTYPRPRFEVTSSPGASPLLDHVLALGARLEQNDGPVEFIQTHASRLPPGD